MSAVIKPVLAPSSAAAVNAAAASFLALVQKLDYLNPEQVELVRKAYRFADQAHLGQKRNSGEPYITHPIAVAMQCAEWRLDTQALMAALLHDAMEDCGISKLDLVERFGLPVAELVDGLTKLDKLQFNTREEGQAESFRKMLLAMARDVRVILVKLADRSHNMRTMSDMPRPKWSRISSETLDIYAPIANRLGLNQTYRELQDLAFRYSMPWRHQVLLKAVTRSRNRRKDLMKKVQAEVELAFQKHDLSLKIFGREKTLYSIYKKMTTKHLSFAQVTDIYGMRLILPSVIDCYTALGILHQLYKPVPGKFKDHIAIAKVNGYQSLHTTLVGPSGINIEFQMRTEPMHVVAEKGVAAHWMYKSQEPQSETAQRLGTQWLQSLLDIQNETNDAAEFWDHVKVDLFPDAVYVFTPKSRIMALPRGATVLDFAYAVHSNIGDHANGARINGELVPLRTELKNGDVIEIVTTPTPHPNPSWLSFVRTGRARSKIRHFLKTMAQTESMELGDKLLAQALRAEGIESTPGLESEYQGLWEKVFRFTGSKTREELLIDIGLGKRVASIVAKRIMGLLSEQGHKPNTLLISQERFASSDTLTQGGVVIDGSENASVQYGLCCHPLPADPIFGYLGHGEGLVIHHEQCNHAQKLRHKDSERFIDVEWSDEPVRLFEAPLMVTVTNGPGVLAKVASAISHEDADITQVNMNTEISSADAIDLRFMVAVRDKIHLDGVLKSLARTSCVIQAQRVMSTKNVDSD